MGWNVYYQIVRDRALDTAELPKLAELVRELNKSPWDGDGFGLAVADQLVKRVVAWGATKLPMDTDSNDPQRICDALSALQAALPDAEVRAADDFNMVGWDAMQRRFDFGAREHRKLIDHDGGAARSVLELVPPDAPAYPPALTAGLAGIAQGDLASVMRTHENMISEALYALSGTEREDRPLIELLAACDPDAAARVGLVNYTHIQHHYDVREALGKVFAAVTDVAALAPMFLDAWQSPRGTYYYGDFPLPSAFASAMAAQPAVREQLISDVDDIEFERVSGDLECRRAERAALLLAESRDPAAVRRLVETLQRWRGVKPAFPILHYVLLPALEGLGRNPHPSAVPAMLSALNGSTLRTRAEHWAMAGAARVCPDLAIPVISVALEQGVGVTCALEAAEVLGTVGAGLVSTIEPYLQYPLLDDRRLASRALGALCGTPVAVNEAIDSELFVLHSDDRVRHEALRAIFHRKDCSLFRSLVVAEGIDAALRRQTDDPCLPFSWRDWKELLPEAVFQCDIDGRTAWARERAEAELGPQRILAVLEPIIDRPTTEVVAQYGPRRLRLSDSIRDALAAAVR